MKKSTQISVPRRVVLPLAAAALLAACDQRPAPEKTTSVGRQAERSRASARAQAAQDDASVTTKVKAALVADGGIGALAIKVHTKDSAVTLSGIVESAAVRNRVREIARAVDDVRSVTDQMRIGS